MSIQKNIDYNAQSLADKALSAKDPSIVQSILGNLTNSIQNGTVKPYVGIPLVQSLNQHLQGLTQQANMVAALRTPPPVAPDQSIGAQTLASAETNPGITAAPSNLPEQMAGGGIVSFADGGDVEHYAKGDYVVPTEDWLEEYKKTRQLGEANLVTKRYGMPTKSVTEAGIKTPYDAAIDYYKQEANKNALAFDQGPALGESVGNLMKRREAWLAGSRDPYTDLPPTGSKYNPSGIADLTPKDTTAEKPPIVIHDDKPATRDTTPQVDVKATKIDALDELISNAKTDRDELKKLILGDEVGRAKDKKTDMWLEALKASFKLMGGTSPYAAVNLGSAGEGLATGISGVISKDRDEKNRRVGQLVALGLKGQDLDAELAKLGMTRDVYESQKKLYEAQAGYYNRRGSGSGSGTAGMGSVPGNVVQSELDRLEAYRINPKSAPFFTSLPLDVQTALLKTDPKSESYQRAMEKFNEKAAAYANSRLGTMRAYGAKQYPTTVSNELP
jgi:hypothetical protein